MSIKSILCMFSGEAREHEALNKAMNLSMTYGAELHVVLVMAPIVADPEYFGRGQLNQAIVGDSRVVETLERDAQDRCSQARTYVGACATKHGMTLIPEDGSPSLGGPLYVRFEVITGQFGESIRPIGRLFDLIVMGHDGDSDDADTLLSALNATGRPVMVVPSKPMAENSDTGSNGILALAWDGSLGATRVLHNTLPLMQSAAAVFVIWVKEDYFGPDKEAEGRLVSFMSLHGLNPRIVHVARDNRSIGVAILAAAKELKADTLVMGAYGHGYISEMIFGGATRYVLAHATTNTLLSH